MTGYCSGDAQVSWLDSALFDFLGVFDRVNRLIADDARQHTAGIAELGVTEFMMLHAVSLGAESPAELTRQLGIHPTATSRIITQLVRAGLLLRSKDAVDARRVVVNLTGKGRRVTDLIARRIRRDLQHKFDAIGPERVTELLDMLHAFLDDNDPSVNTAHLPLGRPDREFQFY